MSPKQNSLIIIDPVGEKAGMDNYDDGLLLGLQEQNIKVYLASNYLNDQFEGKICFGSFKKGVFGKSKNLIQGYFKSFSYIRNKKINNVILHFFDYGLKDLMPVLMAKSMGINVISIFHDISGFNKDDLSFIKKIIFKYSNFVIVHNEFSQNELKKSLVFNPISEAKIKLIKHGGFLNLPDPEITKTIARNKLELSQSKKYVLFFGQIKKTKGLDALIKAFSKIEDPNIELIIAGKVWHDDFSVYQELIDEYKLNSRVLLNIRYISNDEREMLFKASDLLVLPYTEIYQSGVLLMALSFGVPVITSSLLPFQEIIDHGKNGFIFNNETELVELIKNNIHDDQKLKAISDNAIQTIEKDFNWNSIAKNYLPLLKD